MCMGVWPAFLSVCAPYLYTAVLQRPEEFLTAVTGGCGDHVDDGN